MALNIIDLPPNIRFRTSGWRQTGGVTYNRSAFTGATRAIRIGPAARWTCDLEIVPSTNATVYQQTISFMAAASRHDYAVRIPMVDLAQTATAICQTNGANQIGDTIALDGLPASTTILQPGAIITIVRNIDDEQSAVLLTPLTSNASGQATAFLNTPMRAAVPDNCTVRLALPRVLMRARDALAWDVSPGLVHGFQAVSMEEVF